MLSSSARLGETVKKGRQSICYCAGHEIVSLDLEEQKGRGMSPDSLAVSLEGVVCGLVEGVCWGWGLTQSNKQEEEL